MAAMKLNLILCFLLGLFSVSSAQSDYQVRFVSSGTYPHAGKVEVFFDGYWGGICASDWDMNDAEVLCRELGKGYPNTITVSGGSPTGTGTKCLATVKCYGHEEHLSDCAVTKKLRTSSTVESGLVCFPPTTDAGLRLTSGPDQYSGRVEVKLASGSWSKSYGFGPYYDWSSSARRYISNICRQLGFGELNWWDSFEYGSTQSMTVVYSCAYGVAHHASCTFVTSSYKHQLLVGCHKRGSIPCSAPYIPPHARISIASVNYIFGAKVTVTCTTNSRSFKLQCHNKGLWSGPVVSCPAPTASAQMPCNAPYIPKYATVEGLRVRYNYRETVVVTCDTSTIQFTLQCDTRGLWSGPIVSCPRPSESPIQCSAPYVPHHATVEDFRLNYNVGDIANVTCDASNAAFTLQCHNKGLWRGPVPSCPQPNKCNPPTIPVVSFLENVKPRYKIGDQINITCNDDSDSFFWECHKDGLWRGVAVQCSNHLVSEDRTRIYTGYNAQSISEHKGRDYFITGLLVTAVILFILVLMCMAAFVTFMRNRGYASATSSTNTLQDGKESRPLPDVPEGYANYVADDQSLYVEPHLKENGDHIPSYEVYEKPV